MISKNDCVILIHGLGREKSSMHKMYKALNAEGFDAVNWSYNSMNDDILTVANNLAEIVELNSKYHSKINFVTHSMGGIVLRCYLKLNKNESLGKIVMLAPPNQGSAVARFLIDNSFVNSIMGPAGQELKDKDTIERICTIPESNLMVIAGTKSTDILNPTSWVTGSVLEKPNDGTVSVNETKLPNMERFITVDASHTVIMNNETVIEETIKYLKN